jgi:hypothetical protein
MTYDNNLGYLKHLCNVQQAIQAITSGPNVQGGASKNDCINLRKNYGKFMYVYTHVYCLLLVMLKNKHQFKILKSWSCRINHYVIKFDNS